MGRFLVRLEAFDALRHTGQVALLWRMAGSVVRGENYVLASIESGRVGPEQEQPRREFV